jgi:shikimate kinase
MPYKKSSVIILVGMMGSGKSTVGALLAKSLAYNFVDTDELIIQSEKSSISNIFKNKGEHYFRNLESATLNSINMSNVVIATGGGLPIFNDNMDKLVRLGNTIYLKISAAEIFFRLKNLNGRPLFENDIKKTQETLSERKMIYEKSKFQIDCTAKKPNELVEEIKFKLNY